MGEGLNPARADFDAMVTKAIAKYDAFPAGGTEYAARRVAVEAGLRGEVKQELALRVEEAIDAREA